MYILNEMAYERRDAINRCADLGSPFIDHFKKVVDHGINSEDFNHHCKEMQAWFNSVRNIKLKKTNRFISKTQLIDWFFTLGSDIETILEEEYRDLYESFIIHLLTLEDVKECFFLILN